MAALGQSFVVIVRHDRLIDISPCSDIDRRVFIRIRNMSTGDTLKTGLGFAIGFVDMSASRALARGIAGINILDNLAFPLRFVFDKRLKLKERPTAVFGSVGFPYRRPFTDMLEMLKFDSAPGVFGFLDELFGNNVVLIPPESRFVAEVSNKKPVFPGCPSVTRYGCFFTSLVEYHILLRSLCLAEQFSR